ncbi:TraB/GumN family protein [Pontibacterium sp. N1Y112]|uniref:TraB/GumN family protein n=1 Tax=Pontibacterium sinense TaxID=2781979 RepID=A0A8J7FT39_9GAMM|nr:TraB/GumN family protein [Pontibacterium sinense]MBE9396765.1 TraB/GumN family protein [Pontibacterium sinense]
MNKLALWISGALLSFGVAHAETSVWQIEKGKDRLYLGGTIHVLSSSDLPLPATFHRIFDNTDVLVLETDVSQLTLPENSMRLLGMLTYSDGRSLRDVVSAETFGKLQAFASAEGVPITMFERLTPAGVALTVLSIELAKAGIQHEGVDTIFHNQAQARGKPVQGLESIDDHLQFVANMGEGVEDQFVSQTLDDAHKTREGIRTIIDAWRSGDVKALEEAVLDGMPTDYPKLYQELLVQRNNNWMPQILDMFDTPEQEFVLVGAAHLLGPDGLLKQLQVKGYRIRQLE